MPKAHAQLEQAIRSWTFRPGKVDGQPAATDTHLRIRLSVTRVDRQYELQILRASTGPRYDKLLPPKYPEIAVKMRKHGLVLLYVEHDASGKVSKIEPAREAPKPNARLLKAARDAVASWTFRPEAVGGHALPGRALVPVCFRLSDERARCDWKDPETGKPMDPDEGVAMNPAATLETDVSGRVL